MDRKYKEGDPSADRRETGHLPDMISAKKHIVYAKGAHAFDSCDTLNCFYFIIRGKIKISQINPVTSREQIVNLLSGGDMFDIVTLLDGETHEFVSEVLEESEVVEVPIGHVRELIENNPEFNRHFFPYLGRQLRRMEELAVDLSLYEVYERLVRLLARNIDRSEGGETTLRLINNLSNEELASLVGSVRKVVNRNLQKLKKEGVIELSRKQIRLLDLQQLLEKLNY